MKTAKIMVGLPRSGKSTWVKENKTNEVIISADDFRKAICGQKFYGEAEPLVWSIRGIVLNILLSQGIDIIIDETNTTPERRAALIKLFKLHGYTVECVFIYASEQLCIKRAKSECDNNIIPVISKMNEQLKWPDYKEGFDKIMCIKNIK